MKRRNLIPCHFSVGVSLPAWGPSQGQGMGGTFFSLDLPSFMRRSRGRATQSPGCSHSLDGSIEQRRCWRHVPDPDLRHLLGSLHWEL